MNWYRHVRRAQMLINSTAPRSTQVYLFKLLTGVEMKPPDYLDLRQLLREEMIREFEEDRDIKRSEAKETIAKLEEVNCKTSNSKRKPETQYEIGELYAIKRTQFSVGSKLKAKFLCLYKVVRKLPHGRYDVEKVGQHEDPNKSTTVAEFIKKWRSEPNCRQ